MRKLTGAALAALLIALFLSGAALARESDDPAARLAAKSGLMVIAIDTDSGDAPTAEDGYGRMSIYTHDGSEVTKRTVRAIVRVRGNTSKRYPKKSFRVQVVDERGDKRHISIAGLRSDDDWILNPMYADTSKIREALAYELWEDMNSSGSAAQSSRIRYAEAYINGEYWGLYGVQERIDRKQVGGDKRTGVLYKITANARPTAQQLRALTREEICAGIELTFAGSRVSAPWAPAAAYISVFDGGAPAPDCAPALSNIVDFQLFVMLTQAHDCHFKNQFLNCVPAGAGYTLYKIPWDLNDTFGDVWRNSAEDTNFTGYHLGAPVSDDYYEIMLASGDTRLRSALKARWQELRGGLITEEALIARARALHAPLFEAIVRDSERWQECGMGNGNARNIRDIEDFISYIIPLMDEYINNL